ncbi:MAG: tRNA (adenosine(37)-N6)-threonylcarbamoyltransferase complex ATPase subunit type 1 TsaE [Pseudomonadota bacterium]
MMPLDLPDLKATEALAARIAPHLRAGHVIALEGGLGVGKTTFARALVSTLLGGPTDVPSPTYTLVQTYEGPNFPIYHFDLYRLEDPEELDELGWEDTLDGLSLIEWPGKAGNRLPTWRMTLSMEIVDEGRRATLAWVGEDWQDVAHAFGD